MTLSATIRNCDISILTHSLTVLNSECCYTDWLYAESCYVDNNSV